MNPPKAQTHYNRWAAESIRLPARALILSDFHVPYHDVTAIQLAVEYGKSRNANTVIINGDLADFYALSQWEKDPRKRDLATEIATGRTMMHYLREQFPKAAIMFKEGNHEERWEGYLKKKAPDLLGIAAFSWEAVYELDRFHVRLIKDRRPLVVGKLTVIHGHEYRFAIANPVNPARGLFLRAKVHALCGHFHQSSQHAEKRLDQSVISTWSTGSLCNLHPDYAPINNWNNGFAFVDVTATGAFEVANPRIIAGKIYA